jgi:hypothetical protein
LKFRTTADLKTVHVKFAGILSPVSAGDAHCGSTKPIGFAVNCLTLVREAFSPANPLAPREKAGII